MTLALPRPVVCLLLLVAPVALARSPPVSGRELGSRRVVLPAHATEPVPEVRIAPDFLTTLELDHPIDPESLVLEGREERFTLVEVTARAVVLRLAVELAETERLLLRARFVDEQVPTHATLALVPASREVDTQVLVVRQPRSSPALQDELHAVLARCEAGSFLKLALAGWLDEGVTRERLVDSPLESSVAVLKAHLYRAREHAVVVARLRLPEGVSAWAPEEAWLLDETGRVARRWPVWMDAARLLPGEERLVAVELELPSPREARGTWTLELREKGGERSVRLPLSTPGGAP